MTNEERVRQVEFNVVLLQYEQVLTEIENVKLQLVLEPFKGDLSEQHSVEWRARLQDKLPYLEKISKELRERMLPLTSSPNKEAKVGSPQ